MQYNISIPSLKELALAKSTLSVYYLHKLKMLPFLNALNLLGWKKESILILFLMESKLTVSVWWLDGVSSTWYFPDFAIKMQVTVIKLNLMPIYFHLTLGYYCNMF